MTRPDDWPVAPIARRYRVVDGLGRGGQGRVYTAMDELTGQMVAVKLIASASGDHTAQRETAILRALKLPGVARLLDQGRDGDDRYLVTELVDGQPFPGLQSPAPWSLVQGPTQQLLRSLWQVHLAGIVHGDLKPGNVLVTASGLVRLLDFGLAHIASPMAHGVVDSPVGGTLHYLAPEVLAGHRPTPRSDLFALGVILYRTLTDQPPWPAQGIESLVRGREYGPAQPLSDLGFTVPARVETTIQCLLCLDPMDRPPDCGAILDALGLRLDDQLIETPWSDQGPPLGPEDLRAIFGGHERVLHIPSDAASMLFARTGGVRAAVRGELSAWLDQGLVELVSAEGDAQGNPHTVLQIDRATIARLRQAGGEAAQPGANGWQPLTHLLSADASAADVVETATMITSLALEEARLADTLAAAELAFAILRETPLPLGQARTLLEHYARAAVGTASPRVLERAAWELRRLPAVPGREALAAVVDAMRLALLGRARDALELAVSLPPLGAEPLSALVPTVQAQAAHQLPVEAEDFVVDQLHAWVQRWDTDSARAREALWLGHLRRRQGRPAQALDLFAQAAGSHPDRAFRLQAHLEQTRALLDLGDLNSAERQCHRSLKDAALARDATREATAWWILREIAHREDTADGPDMDLVDAVHSLGEPLLAGRIALVEAVIARSHGYDDDAAALAMRARAGFYSADHQPQAALAAALAAVSGDAAGLWWARENFPPAHNAEEAAVLLQAAALMLDATGLDAWNTQVRDLAARVEPRAIGAGLGGVLSISDALRLAGVDSTDFEH
ncbi:MAG: protein kinase [Oligoflexia bacterium]|nr:protein kinase [Oligoflexia bacterium]